MKMQFLLIGLISIALFGSTPVAVAHGHSGGGAGHGRSAGGNHGHGAWGGHGRSAGGSHGRVAWGGHGHRFHHGGRFFRSWFWLLWLRLSVVVEYPGYPYYGDTYYGNPYYGNSDPRSSATKALQAALARRGYYSWFS